jgi:hypothetical protein
MDPDESSESNEKNLKTETKVSKNPFKIEWSLFWGGLLGDQEEVSTTEVLKVLTREQVAKLIKDLSGQRKILHKQIESVNKEIELNTVKLESLRLVGSEPEETIHRLNELSDRGQDLSSELQTLNQKLKLVRDYEKEFAGKEWA